MQSAKLRAASVTVIDFSLIKSDYQILRFWRSCQASIPCELLKEGIEVFELGVFDNDFAATLVVFYVDPEAEGALEAVLDLADVGVDGGSWFGVFLAGLFWVQEALNVGFRLANRKRKSNDALGCLFDFLGVFEGKKG